MLGVGVEGKSGGDDDECGASFRRLSSEKMADRRRKNLCFSSDAHFFVNHVGWNSESSLILLGARSEAGDGHGAHSWRLTAVEMAGYWDVDSTCKHMVMVGNNGKDRYAGEYEGIKWYKTFTDPFSARQYIQEHGALIFINANGVAVDKGVIVAITLEETYEAVDSMLVKGDFGSAGCRVIVEEFLEGEEVSFLAIGDGENAIPLESAEDHKRVGEGETRPNLFRLTMGLRGFKQWDPGGFSHYLPFCSP